MAYIICQDLNMVTFFSKCSFSIILHPNNKVLCLYFARYPSLRGRSPKQSGKLLIYAGLLRKPAMTKTQFMPEFSIIISLLCFFAKLDEDYQISKRVIMKKNFFIEERYNIFFNFQFFLIILITA
jgi:hypothetical protein